MGQRVLLLALVSLRLTIDCILVYEIRLYNLFKTNIEPCARVLGTGVIRTLRANPKAAANMVPVDLCVNGIIATAWNVGERYQGKISPITDIPVYNFCTAPENQLTWGDFTIKTTKYGLMYPTLKAMWYLCYANNPNKFMHLASILFLHYLPALLMDAFCMCLGRKPK